MVPVIGGSFDRGCRLLAKLVPSDIDPWIKQETSTKLGDSVEAKDLPT